MTTREEVFPSNWFKAVDLEGRPLNMEIEYMAMELIEFGSEAKEKPTLKFKGIEKPLILNVTNWKSIEKLCGKNSDDWPGKQLQLFPTKVEAFGETHDAVRVRAVGAADASTPTVLPG
jgi:hypothetical protein